MTVQVAQIAAPLLLLVGTFLLGTLPILFVHKLSISRLGSKLLSFSVCLGGGVLFCVTFAHIIPDVIEGFKDVKSDFPVAEVVVCLGFLAVYAVEELVHLCIGHSSESGNGSQTQESTSLEDSCPGGRYFGDRVSIAGSSSVALAPSHDHHQAGFSTTDVTVSGLLIIAALSFHSLFEGLALGLQGSDRDTWLLFMGVSIHKMVLALVVGFDLSAGGVKAKVIVSYMAVFAIMSPIGALIGILTSKNFDGVPVAAMNGLAAGTLLYVTFFEVLQRQQNTNLPRIVRLLAVLIGFIFMLALIAAFPDRD